MIQSGEAAGPWWHLFVPKLVTVLRQGYGIGDLRDDVLAGLTVAIVALPLSMALAIASGATPDKGLVTAIVAGLLISLLGGSRFQIGGPTGAFVVVVFDVIARYGYDGLLTATLMAGVIVCAGGLAGLGTYIKYIPQPVVTGFTAGIAVIIFSSQVRDFLGLELAEVPAEFVEKWHAYAQNAASFDPATLGLAGGSLALILLLRAWLPKLPFFLIAIVAAAALVPLLGLSVDTVGSRFGAVPGTLPTPAWPDLSWSRVVELLPSALTIAFLAAVESLLSAMVADGMTGRRHRSNCELVAQGLANCGSALFGGLPATGAIARTATNIRAGARSPLAGVLHAAFLLLFMFALAPLMVHIPMAALAAVLVVVAWNMSEAHRFVHLMSAPVGDRAVLIVTFLLTVLVDLTVAIEVGVVLAAIVFMHRMANVVAIQSGPELIDRDVDDFLRPASDRYTLRAGLPEGVELFQIHGPVFFGMANRLAAALDRSGAWPKAIVLRMDRVPFTDATGAMTLNAFLKRCQLHGTFVVITGVSRRVKKDLLRFGMTRPRRSVAVFNDFGKALELARQKARGDGQPGPAVAGAPGRQEPARRS